MARHQILETMLRISSGLTTIKVDQKSPICKSVDLGRRLIESSELFAARCYQKYSFANPAVFAWVFGRLSSCSWSTKVCYHCYISALTRAHVFQSSSCLQCGR